MKETQEKVRAALSDVSVGIRRSPRRLTVEQYLRDWLETSVRPQRRSRTYDSYADFVLRYIIPSIGRIPLAKLEPVHVQRMLVQVGQRKTPQGRPLSPRACERATPSCA